MDILRIAVVGVGGRAGAHLTTIPKLKDAYQIAAVCDIREEQAQQVAAKHRVPGYTDVEKMLDAENLDVILITAPPEGHHIITAQAAERAVHVISETPMSFSLACARLMLETAEKHNIFLEVSENVRRWPAERLKRKIIESGMLGTVTQIHCWYVSGGYHGISAIRNCACGEATRVIGHAQNVQLAMSRWFDPFARRAVGEMPHIGTMPAVPDSGARVATWELGVANFANGITAIYEYPIGAARVNYWEVDGTRGQIIGSDVYLYEDGQRNRYPIETVTREQDGISAIDHLKINTDPPIIWENPYTKYLLTDADDVARADVLMSIHRAVTEGAALDYGGIGGYRDVEFLIGVRESAMRQNAPISFPIEEELVYDQRQHEAYRQIYGHDPLEITQTPLWKQEARLSQEI
ncbi:MAG: Gfo/Idh/MocA family oxidoreductase [Candidatus Poribacteria bacterium]|nr:Gfo/Idh/MocA family oxidoreductase [Candidatus Poribacteria bacterium]